MVERLVLIVRRGGGRKERRELEADDELIILSLPDLVSPQLKPYST